MSIKMKITKSEDLGDEKKVTRECMVSLVGNGFNEAVQLKIDRQHGQMKETVSDAAKHLQTSSRKVYAAVEKGLVGLIEHGVIQEPDAVLNLSLNGDGEFEALKVETAELATDPRFEEPDAKPHKE